MSGPADRALRRSRTGGRARVAGRGAEVWAALWLLARGYRILGFRQKVQGVEIDLAVRRGGVLAVIEVKRRAKLDAALHAVAPEQLRRLRRAGEALAERQARPGHGGRPSVRIDLLALAPGRFPRHIPDAWRGCGEVGESGPWP